MCIDQFILKTAEQNPRVVVVKKTERVVLKCRINQQKGIGDLVIRWKRSGRFVQTESANRGGSTFDFVLESASLNDSGVYQCLVVSRINDGVIDSGNEIQLYIDSTVCKYSVFMII